MKKLLLFAGIFIAFGANAQVRLVKDIYSGVGSSNPLSFTVYNGRLYFAAARSATLNYRSIFVTDGTAAGTINIRFNDPVTGPVALNNYGTVLFYQYNSDLYFDAQDSSTSDMNVMKLSGVSNAASSVFNISNYTGTSFCRFEGAAGLNDKILFNPLWVGQMEPQVIDLITPSNSGVLNEIYAGNGSSYPKEFTVLGNNCFFTAEDGINGRELWKTDGTNSGTSLYLDVFGGSGTSNPNQLNVLGSALTFVASHPTLGRELFKTNGSGSLTVLKDINTSGDSNPTNCTVIDGLLYFSASNGVQSQALWVSAGTTLSTYLVATTTANGNPRNFVKMGNDVFFVNDTYYGAELWITDGVAGGAGTHIVKDINTGSGVGSNPANLTVYNGKLYFTANNGTNGTELWVSDGTDAGTTMVADIYPGGNSSSISGLTLYNNELYFGATASLTIGQELYAYMDPALAVSQFNSNQYDIILSPNPSHDFFSLSTDLVVQKVQIYSITGQLIKTFSQQNNYSITDLIKGSYIVKVSTTEGIESKVLLIE